VNQPLYTVEILRLAASLPAGTGLQAPHGVGEKRSITCGSHVRTEISLDDQGCVYEIAQHIQACAFGQASAALVGRSAAGKTREEVAVARVDFASWLLGNCENPGSWPGLTALEPARSKRPRHPAMLLPFDALIAAMDDAWERFRP